MQLIFIPGLLCTDLVCGQSNQLRDYYHAIDADVVSYDSISKMANAVIDNIKEERVAIVGISMGGYVAIDAALKLGKKL